MIELPEDFRDLLIELRGAEADFVVLGGHAVAFPGTLVPPEAPTLRGDRADVRGPSSAALTRKRPNV